MLSQRLGIFLQLENSTSVVLSSDRLLIDRTYVSWHFYIGGIIGTSSTLAGVTRIGLKVTCRQWRQQGAPPGIVLENKG